MWSPQPILQLLIKIISERSRSFDFAYLVIPFYTDYHVCFTITQHHNFEECNNSTQGWKKHSWHLYSELKLSQAAHSRDLSSRHIVIITLKQIRNLTYNLCYIQSDQTNAKTKSLNKLSLYTTSDLHSSVYISSSRWWKYH